MPIHKNSPFICISEKKQIGHAVGNNADIILLNDLTKIPTKMTLNYIIPHIRLLVTNEAFVRRIGDHSTAIWVTDGIQWTGVSHNRLIQTCRISPSQDNQNTYQSIFIHIFQGYFTWTGAIRLSQCKWWNPVKYWQNHNKTKCTTSVYIFHRIHEATGCSLRFVWSLWNMTGVSPAQFHSDTPDLATSRLHEIWW